MREANSCGIAPVSYGKGGKGAEIRFAIVPCELGLLLIAKTAKGICAVRFGDDEAKLEANLRSEFHAANIHRASDEDALSEEIDYLLQLLRGQKPHGELPLDIPKTSFQWQVWQELMNIPLGQTVTYGEIAARIGNPKASRAVGAACGQNPVALIIPCHRVIGKSGSFTGYEWGITRKQKLLQLERAK